MLQFLSQLQDKLPEKKVGLVPADALFIRQVELPQGMETSDVPAFLQLDLEGGSPFPIEQLCWGFIHDPASPLACVYATPRSRIKALGLDHPETFHHLLPGFATLLGEPRDRAAIRFIAESGVVTALWLQPDHPVPQKVLSRRVRSDIIDDTALLETRDKLAATLDSSGYELEIGLWVGEGIELDHQAQIIFKHRFIQPGAEPNPTTSRSLPMDEARIWDLDLRDGAYANAEKLIRKRSRWIWASLRAGAWAAVILLLLQAGSYGLAGLTRLQSVKIDRLEPQATRVENKLTLAGRLNQSTEEDLRPFLLLEAINPIRPDSIFFEKVRARSFNELQVEGKSTEGVTPVNSYADAIAQLPFVSGVENNSQTRNNQTSFEIVISFAEMPPPPAGGFDVPADTESETAANENG